MKKKLLIKAINKLIKSHFNIKKRKSNEIFSADNTRQWDSLGHLTLISKIEKKFKIKFNNSDIPNILNEKKIYNKLSKIIKNNDNG